MRNNRGGGGVALPQVWDRIGGEDGFVLPLGTVTLLLADIEGSTRLWEDHGGVMAARMAELDGLVTEVVAVHSGVRPVEQGEGDSFVAAFSKASDAVTCALDLQRRLEADEREPSLRYRIGIHAGEVSQRGDGNYSGGFINRTARLRDVGHGGQVLLSRVAADLVADALPDGAGLTDVGQHRLRDLTRPEQLFQLTHPDLAREFPPLRSLDTLPHNLPVQLSSFVGRQRELEELAAAVAHDGTRLLTLTGSGGCGKTRLALEVTAAMIERFSDGVWFCDLSVVTDPDRVPAELAAAIGLREQHGADGWDAHLASYFANRNCLVLLDNCEHVVDACAALVDELLRHAHHLVVLATSREPLGVTGEVTWRVPSLAAPVPSREGTPIEALSQFDAVRLFIDRARQARPNFAVTDDNAPAVAAICARLDGIPLAIELAAARVRVLGVDKIAAGLDDRFRLLGGGLRTAIPRQQTLLASVAWSHDMLDEHERVVLRRLAVFAAGFDLDAAEHVGAGDGVQPDDVFEVLTRLVDRSLVQVDDAGGRVRYRLLETMRQFAGDRLVESGEAAAVRNRHLAWYDTLVDEGWAHTYVARQPEGEHGPQADFDADYANIREALEWALVTPEESRIGLHIVGQLWLYWTTRGTYAEGRAWTAELLAAVPDAQPDIRAAALLTLSSMAAYQNDFAVSVASAQEAAAIARDTGNKALLARALENVGWPLGLVDYNAACHMLREGIGLAREAGDTRTTGMCLFFLAFLEGVHGELTAARAHFDEAIAERGLPPGTFDRAEADIGKALVVGWQGDVATSVALAESSIPVFAKLGDPYWEMLGRLYLAMTFTNAGDVEQARTALDHSSAVAASLSSPAVVLVDAMETFLRAIEGRFDEVDQAAARALPMLEPYGPSVGRGLEAQVRTAIALAHLARGESAEASATLTEALAAARNADNPSYSPLAMVAIATALMESDDVAAEQCAHEALSMCARSGALVTAPALLEALSAVARRQGSHTEACRLIAAASSARTLQGTRPLPWWHIDINAETAALRDAMGADAFDTAWAEGAALSLDAAIGYARRGRGERKRPSKGWASLTPTEERVVDLVADGRSNPEIAERLFMSRRTVASHLTHIFTKLDVRTRSELTAYVLRRR